MGCTDPADGSFAAAVSTLSRLCGQQHPAYALFTSDARRLHILTTRRPYASFPPFQHRRASIASREFLAQLHCGMV